MTITVTANRFSTSVVINIGGNEMNQSEKRASPLYKREAHLPSPNHPISLRLNRF